MAEVYSPDYTVPSTWILDREGEIVWVEQRSGHGVEEIEAVVEPLLAGR